MKQKLIIWQLHEGNLSGANHFVLDYIRKFSSEIKLHIILPHKGDMCIYLDKMFVPYTVIPQYGWARKIKSQKNYETRIFVRNFVALIQTLLLIQRLSPSLYFTNTITPYIGAKAAFLKSVKHVWWIHEFGEEDFGFKIGFGDSKYAYKKMSLWSSLIICNSSAVANKFEKLIFKVPFHINYQSVSWHLESLPQKKTAYLMFGEIRPSKGHLEVIEAMGNNIKNGKKIFPLEIFGPCNTKIYYDELISKINELELSDYIKIRVGYFSKYSIIPNYKYLIMASTCEAFGRVVVEAIKSDVKIIAKNSGALPEHINECNGVLYNNNRELQGILSGDSSIPSCKNYLNYNEEEYFSILNSKIDCLI